VINLIIFLLSGKAQSGKDTFFEFTQKMFGWFKNGNLAVGRIAFADELKRFAERMGWDGAKDERGGKFLQDLGTVGRNYNADMWVDCAMPELRWYQESKNADIICFTDCRYPNEIERINSLSWITGRVVTVRIDRPGHVSNRDPSHVSEIALDNFDFDYYIKNDGSLKEYRIKVIELVQKILEENKKG
jgi:hypothetical protein